MSFSFYTIMTMNDLVYENTKKFFKTALEYDTKYDTSTTSEVLITKWFIQKYCFFMAKINIQVLIHIKYLKD